MDVERVKYIETFNFRFYMCWEFFKIESIDIFMVLVSLVDKVFRTFEFLLIVGK